MERLDLYLRLKFDQTLVEKEFRKFSKRLERVRIGYHAEQYQQVAAMMERKDEFESLRSSILNTLQQIFS